MSKHLGTLNVHAGDAGDIQLEISTDTPLDRIAAVLRFADDMTTEAAAAAPAVAPDDAPDPPLPVEKTRAPRTMTAPAPASSDESIDCDVCGRACSGKRGLAIHRKAMHPDALAAGADAPAAPADAWGPDDVLLRCSDCDFATAVTKFEAGLRRHTKTEHGRGPTDAERTPRTQADVDAEE